MPVPQPGPDFQAFLGLWHGAALSCQERRFLEKRFALWVGVIWSGGDGEFRAEAMVALATLPLQMPLPAHSPPLLTVKSPRRHFVGTASQLPGRCIINSIVLMFIGSEGSWSVCARPGVEGTNHCVKLLLC